MSPVAKDIGVVLMKASKEMTATRATLRVGEMALAVVGAVPPWEIL